MNNEQIHTYVGEWCWVTYEPEDDGLPITVEAMPRGLHYGQPEVFRGMYRFTSRGTGVEYFIKPERVVKVRRGKK